MSALSAKYKYMIKTNKLQAKKLTSSHGFTIIELLVVITIIGTLASISLNTLNTARVKARDAKRKADLRSIATALEFYYDDHGYYPDVINLRHADNTRCRITPSFIYSTDQDTCWTALANELMPYINLPIDPLNNAIYNYIYFSCEQCSRAGTKQDYDLIAILEFPADLNRAGVNCGMRFHLSGPAGPNLMHKSLYDGCPNGAWSEPRLFSIH